MRNGAQTLLGYQLASLAADSVGLVLDTDKRGFQVLNELLLMLRQTAGLLARQHACAFLQNLECWRCVENKGTRIDKLLGKLTTIVGIAFVVIVVVVYVVQPDYSSDYSNVELWKSNSSFWNAING